MFGIRRFTSLLGEKPLRAISIGLIVGMMVLASSAGYTVQAGDTLGHIAKKHGTTVAALVQANQISNPNLIRIGQSLTIPGSGGAATTHKVRLGDSLGAIAARYKTSVSAIVQANGIANPNLIRVGQTLTIPGPGGTVAPTVNHVVRAGETLSQIAVRYQTSASTLVKLNGIKNADSIRVGQTLKIPAAGQGGGGPSSGMVCPVPGSKFVDDYGYIKPDGRFHQGIDMFAPRGSAVYAPVAGTVEAINGTLGGLQFWLHADDGNVYIGTHLDAFGQVGRVSAGATIGRVGDTGNARGAPPHVHLEILVDGKSTNPFQRLVAACR